MLNVHNKLQNNYEYFAKEALKIKNKLGEMIPFEFNRAQKFIHAKLEEQKASLGYIRALLLKGRQQGASTYVGGRYYHKATRLEGKSVFILSHEAKTTAKLFGMVKRYQDNIAGPLRPQTGTSNVQSLVFSALNSDYTVGTAGNADVGRGGTVQFFHGSEVAFWQNTEDLQKGALQSVADMPGTEIILESTANGMANMFYRKCMDALAGIGDYILIFIPWFWQDEYERNVAPDFVPTTEEEAYMLENLQEFPEERQLRKISWRRAKIIDLKSEWEFKQEYPANPIEAFQTSGEPLISPKDVLAARKRTVTSQMAPLIVGVDPSLGGKDKTVVAFRRGREFTKYYRYDRSKPMELAGKLAHIIDTEKPAKMFIDFGAGEGTIDRLIELGYNKVVTGVYFAETPIQPDRFLNKRAEILIAVRDWIQDDIVSIPDDDLVHADLLAIPREIQGSNKKLQIVAKDKIKKSYGRSPDIFDAIALTFAYPVNLTAGANRMRKRTSIRKRNSPLSTLSRMREGQKKISVPLGTWR